MPKSKLRHALYLFIALPQFALATSVFIDHSDDLDARFSAFWALANPHLTRIEDNCSNEEDLDLEELRSLWIANRDFLKSVWNLKDNPYDYELQRLIAIIRPTFAQEDQKQFLDMTEKAHSLAPHHHLYNQGIAALEGGDDLTAWQSLRAFAQHPDHVNERGRISLSGHYPSEISLELEPPLSGLGALVRDDPDLTKGKTLAILGEALGDQKLPLNELEILIMELRSLLHKNDPKKNILCLKQLALRSVIEILVKKFKERKHT